MSPTARLLTAVLLAGAVLTAVAAPVAASDGVGLTYDQWRTGRLVLGVVGLTFLAVVAVRAVRARLARRGTSGPG